MSLSSPTKLSPNDHPFNSIQPSWPNASESSDRRLFSDDDGDLLQQPMSEELHDANDGSIYLNSAVSPPPTMQTFSPKSKSSDSTYNNGTVSQIPKKRDERRRVTHNEVERRRRDKINNWITKLGHIILSEENQRHAVDGGGISSSKSGILAKACEYITELKQNNENLGNCKKELDILERENKKLEEVNERLKHENSYLRQRLETELSVIDKRTYKCSNCEKVTKEQVAVITHERIHGETTPHVCRLFGKGLKQTLKEHLKTTVHMAESSDKVLKDNGPVE